jgi:YfiH family protein
LGTHVGDAWAHVRANRSQLAERLGAPVVFPTQVHGVRCIEVTTETQSDTQEADACFTRLLHQPIGILTADCLPVLFASSDQVACAHAGWRGLVGGVIETTLATFDEPSRVSCWLGPAIGPSQFEVGPEVIDAFLTKHSQWRRFLKASAKPGHGYLDLQSLAADILQQAGVPEIHRLDACTVNDPTAWYSYRRDRVTGRMASCIMRTE